MGEILNKLFSALTPISGEDIKPLSQFADLSKEEIQRAILDIAFAAQSGGVTKINLSTIGKVLKKTVPKIKSTDDAVKFSKQANTKQLGAIRFLRDYFAESSGQFLEKQDYDRAISEAVKGQFMREVVEAVEDPTRFDKVLNLGKLKGS